MFSGSVAGDLIAPNYIAFESQFLEAGPQLKVHEGLGKVIFIFI